MKILYIVYLVPASLYIVFMDQLPGHVGVGIKALPIFVLMFFAMFRLSGIWRTGMLFALLFSAGGDVLLALHAIHGELFIAGLGSFLIAQLIYAGLFWTHRSSDNRRTGVAVFSFVVTAVTGMLIVPYTGEMQAPVMAYILAIGVMLMGTAVCDRPLNRLFVGAFIFVLSDLLIAMNQFIVVIPWAGVFIMITYYVAQYLIVMGVLSKVEN